MSINGVNVTESDYKRVCDSQLIKIKQKRIILRRLRRIALLRKNLKIVYEITDILNQLIIK